MPLSRPCCSLRWLWFAWCCYFNFFLMLYTIRLFSYSPNMFLKVFCTTSFSFLPVMCSPLLTLLSVGWCVVCAIAPGQSVCPWPSSPFSSTSCWCLSLFPFTTSPVTPHCHPGHTSWESWHAPTTPLWGSVVQLSHQLISHMKILPIKMPIRMPKVMCEHILTWAYQWKRLKMPQWTYQSM